MTLIAPGKYSGRLIDYGFKTTKDEAPQISAFFEVDVSGAKHVLPWYGYFTEKSVKHTTQALMTMGFKETTPIDAIARGTSSKALDTTKEYSLTVETNEYNGKQSSRVQWINPQSAIKDTVTGAEFSRLAQQFNLQSLVSDTMKQLKTSKDPF
jgi:hypothetical protein